MNKPLREQIETVVEDAVASALDTQDPGILGYVENLMIALQHLEQLPEIDLSSPEAARASLELLEERQREIAERLRTTQALKHLLERS